MLVLVALLAALLAALGAAIIARRGREPVVRLLVEPYRNDRASVESLLATYCALHALLGSRRALALEIHLDRRAGGAPLAWFALRCPAPLARHVTGALRASYPNVRLRRLSSSPSPLPGCVALHRRAPPHALAPSSAAGGWTDGDALLRALAVAGPPASVELLLRPAPRAVELLLPEHGDGEQRRPPAGALFWAEPRVWAGDRRRALAIASALNDGVGPRLVRSLSAGSGAADGLARPRPRRTPRRLYHAGELTGLWQLPSPEFAALPCLRSAVPLAPAPPGITRPRSGRGLLRDDHGAVTIDAAVRRQHCAVVGAVEQGKSSFLVASAREDLARGDCAVIVLDPKGESADAVLGAVPDERTCTLLDLASPTCGFNPLAVAAPPDAIADQVVAALRGLFSEGEVRGSSDRYLRNATIAALATDPAATLWEVARLLEVGPAGAAARAAAAERLIELPDYAEVAGFLADELPAQLADARATTTAKLDAPANKLARVLNSPAVKRVLRNDSLQIDFDELIDRREVLVVRGALGELGPGNVSVLMQLLLGMLDAALSRVQDRRAAAERNAVALKIDEAPLVINEAFAQTLALKRSAGLETVACWQTDAQWQPELREQLDALFAHRVLFATASATDARAAASLLLAEFTDQLRPSDEQTIRLATPDVRLHLPRHTAIVSWTTPAGRERPFIATTLPIAFDRERLERHAARQRERGGRPYGASEPSQSPPPAAQPPVPLAQSPPSALPSAHAELLELARAQRVRWLAPADPRPLTVGGDDRALLEWLAAARCATTAQVHARYRPGQALTGTQRQLKRLADAGLLARFQLHREDGGALPQCCCVTPHAVELLGLRGRRAPELGDAELPRLLGDVRTTGWLLALERVAGASVSQVLGPGRAAIAPPDRLGPSGLELPPGLRARDFTTRTAGTAAELERFAAVRPDAVVETRADGTLRDLLVVRDDGGAPAELERYDHLVSGWWRHVPRYSRLGAPPRVVVVCGDPRAAALAADPLLRATLAQIGVAPERWQRPGRELIGFAGEPRLHAGSLECWSAPATPGGEPMPGRLLAAAPPGEALAPWR
ncbi:MAG TPA: replication-relaxation family protein [Solirubrobacteraceae bacterium]|nr:replication-relaxation family protein [Solirubrobacteraceae bacterium]